MLEESSFANKKADYFWLLLQSSVMLLVNSLPTFHHFNLTALFYFQYRHYHLYLTSLSYPHPWLSFPSISGHDDIPRRPYLSLA
jgi:hypothetical protein